MRRLGNTLYVLTDGHYLSLKDENVVVENHGEVIAMVPLQALESILSFSYAGASPALMGACSEKGVSLAFYSQRGRYLGSVSGGWNGNVLLRQRQYLACASEEDSLPWAKSFLLGKIYNAKWTLERAARDHPLRVPVDRIKFLSTRLSQFLRDVKEAPSYQRILGLEGEAAQCYFEGFRHMILRDETAFAFGERTRRPPLDRMNALLSFAYSILARDCEHALSGVGLDPFAGFLHRLRPGRPSLALDLMEELRAPFADRLVLSLVNKRMIRENDFRVQEDGATFLNETGRKTFFQAWQERKKEEITHPFLKEKIPWGIVPHVQALLLARALRRDLDGYLPFFWK